jgi:hypothetical protein
MLVDDHVAWNKWPAASGSICCADECGGARVDRPGSAKILAITRGFSMAAMILKCPPQLGPRSMTISKPGAQIIPTIDEAQITEENYPIVFV